MNIDTIDLARIDLNFLVHFDALLTDRNVTRAAARVGIGQSAMSHNLARLGELFGDGAVDARAGTDCASPRERRRWSNPCGRRSLIFRRSYRGISHSIRQRRCANVQVRFAVKHVGSDRCLRRGHTCARSRPASSCGSITLIPPVSWTSSIPTNWIKQSAMMLLPHGQAHHKRRLLFTETYLCIFNAATTGIAPPISVDDYVRLPHVLMSLKPGRSVRGVVDEKRSRNGDCSARLP